MAYLTSDNTPFPVAREAMYPSGTTGTIPGGNTSTGFSVSLGSLELAGSASLFDAQTATIVIVNTGTAQTINAATLTFSDSIGSQTPAISYALSSVSIASGASMQALISLTGGILKNASVSITFASAPVAGSVTVQATLQSGSASSGGGGGSSDVTIHDNGTPSQHATVDSSGNLHVADAKVPATGQATMANSLPVVIASNQSAIPVNAGTNLNTSLLALENGGNLATTATQTSNASTVLGGTSDAGVFGDVVGSISAKLRGLSKVFNAIFDPTNNWLNVQLASLIAGEDVPNNVLKVEQRYSNMYVTTNGSTTVKSGTGFLHLLVFGSSPTGTVTLWDGSAPIHAFAANAPVRSYIYDTTIITNLVIVTTSAVQILVSFR